MKKITPLLILFLIVGVVSISGCISVIDSDDNSSITDTISQNESSTDTIQTTQSDVIKTVNQSGNIVVGKDESSNIIEKNNAEETNVPKISKDEIEKEIVRIMRLNNPYCNYTANATLIYKDGTPVYVIDVFDDFGWFGYFEVNGNTGPVGNDQEGYGVDGGAVRGETGDEPNPIEGVMPKLSVNKAREIMDSELKTNYSIENATYIVNGYLKDDDPYYNITIEEYDENTQTTNTIGTADMNANTGEIISLNITTNKKQEATSDNSKSEISSTNEKIYSVDEAGDYIDIEYKGKKISVRENYPYYSPQNDKIFYSQKEEAESLYNDPRGD